MQNWIDVGAAVAYSCLFVAAFLFQRRMKVAGDFPILAFRSLAVLGFGFALIVLGFSEQNTAVDPNAMPAFWVGWLGAGVVLMVMTHNLVRGGLVRGGIACLIQLLFAPFAVVVSLISIVAAVGVLLGLKGVGILVGER